jgi:hypothetical protein
MTEEQEIKKLLIEIADLKKRLDMCAVWMRREVE